MPNIRATSAGSLCERAQARSWWQLPAHNYFGAVAGGSAVAEGARPWLESARQLTNCGLRRACCLLKLSRLMERTEVQARECCAYHPRCLCMEVRVRGGILCDPSFVCVVCVQVLRFALQHIGRLSRLADSFLSQRVKERFACSAQRCLAQIVLSIPA